MPKIPVYEPQVQYRPALGDPGAVAAGGERIAKGVSGLLDSMGDFAVAQRKAREASELSSLNLEAAKGIGELEFELDKDTDFQTVPQKFEERAKAMREDLLGRATSSTVKSTFQRDFDKLVVSKGISVKRDAFKREVDSGVADLDGNLDLYAGLAARARNDVEREDIIGMARLEIERKADAGFITRESAGKRERTFLSKLDEAAILGEITTQPERALDRLSDPTQLRNIDEVARSRLIDTTTRRIDTLTRERVAAFDRAERLADKNLRLQGDELAKEGWDRHAGGNLTVDWLRENKRTFSEPDYRALLHAATSEPARADDKETLIDLRTRIDTEDLSADASRALREGKIKPETYNSIIGQNRAALRDDQPASPYKSGRELVRSTLDPTNLLSGAAAQIAKGGMASALNDYDEWAVANPKATRQAHIEEARATIARYQVVNYEQMAISQGLPRFYKGTRSDIDADALDKAEGEVIRQLDSRGLSEAQATQELQKIDNWRAILRAKPPTGKK